VGFTPEVAAAESRRGILDDEGVSIFSLLPQDANWCYDGGKILYTSAPLSLGGGGAAGWLERDPGVFTLTAFEGTRRQIVVTLKDPHTLTYERFNEEGKRKELAALDVALKQQPLRVLKGIGDAFYDPLSFEGRSRRAWAQAAKALGKGGEFQMVFGYRQSIIMTGRGAMLQLDRAVSVMSAPLPLLDFIANKLRKPKQSVRLEDCAKANSVLVVSSGKKWEIISSQNKKRPYKLRGIDTVPASKSMFAPDHDDGEMISVEEYYKRKGVNLVRPDLPCVCVGGAKDVDLNGNPSPGYSIRIPLEFFSFAPCQPVKGNSPEIQSQSIKEAAAPPNVRFRHITEIHKDLLREADQVAPAFGVKLGPQLVKATAKQLEPAKIAYRDDRGNEVLARINMQKGEWRVCDERNRDLCYVQPGKCDAFTVINFSDARDLSKLEAFVSKLMSMAQQRKMDLGRRWERIIDGTRCRNGADIEHLLDQQLRACPQLGLVICLLSGNASKNGEELYPAIKRWSHVKTGIATQCVQASDQKAAGKLATSPQYHAGILLKMNLKLGGENVHAPKAHGGLALLRSCPSIVFGVDVHHPAPGSPRPSWAALVATMDPECARYHTIVAAQPKQRRELVDLTDKVRASLRKYNEANGVYPQQIVFFRDGIADNMFAEEGQKEIGMIRQACFEENGETYLPRLIYIVVQQRTRCRLANLDFSQVPAGTFVDGDITAKEYDNFYMVAQHGLKGTARPLHCHVLENDAGATRDEIERLTFDLCHLYARATKLVSRPAPVYYAHRAAFLAQYYQKGFKEREDAWESGSASSHGSHGSHTSDLENVRLNLHVANKVYFA